MALSRKYATLPDLDLAPDIYETPDLTDDTSTLQTSTAARSASPDSSHKDLDEGDGPEIDRQRLHPDQARDHFSGAQIDANDVDFSDRINGKRKSYRTTSRRRRKGDDGAEELGDFSDEEDESLERKLARLRREVEEVKAEFGKREAEKERTTDLEGESNAATNVDEITTLSGVLDSLLVSKDGSQDSAEMELARKLGTGMKAGGASNYRKETPTAINPTESEQPASYTVTYAPSYQQNQALAKAADFDTRLTLLEKALGISSSALSDPNNQRASRAILPTLDMLHGHISILSETSASSLDTVSRRVRQLTQEAERLIEARTAAKAAQDALKLAQSADPNPGRSATNGTPKPEQPPLEDPEQTSKINALYGTLSTIESLSPLLPSVLDRLRSLRAIHADAATASESLARAEKRQDEMTGEIRRWREGLEKVEGAMREGEGSLGKNMRVVEGWVKDLEGRMTKMDQ
ncbi:MAG: hypothetical protein M1827_004647 [Pycnora praestabilis]|nr:MAG: hypothetical protein M1827_004647 [Pycnora praestabilis]